MSYILEALKKAEQRSETRGVPHLLSYEDAVEHRRVPLWAYLVAAALLLNAGTILWWAQNTVVLPPAAPPPALVAPAESSITPAEPKRLTPMQEVREQTSVKGQAPMDTSRALARPLRKESRNSARSADNLATRPAPSAPPEREARAESTASRHTGVVSLSELPPSVRSSLPAFRVSGHAYSPEPASRVVRINEQILQEGQSLAPGVKVEEITPGGIVLSYQGHRFQIGITAN